MLRDDFGIAQQQEKATNGLGCRLTLTGNSDISGLGKANATNNAKNEINGTEWYVPH